MMIIQIEHLSKTYGDLQVLSDINLNVKQKEIYGIIGVSGVGKSTLLRCINGLECYDEGSLKVNGIEVKGLKKDEIHPFRKNIGIIFQNFALLERKTVFENIGLPIECWSRDKNVKNKKVLELLDLVGLADKKDSKPNQLSGGQKQRVAIARALSLEPKILLCDEATSALDPATTNSILNLLDDINKKLGITIVIVTHEMSVIKSICDKVSIMENGKIITDGTVEKIFLEKPETLDGFIGEYEVDSKDKPLILRLNVTNDAINEPLLYTLAAEAKIKFNIVSANIDTYKNKKLGHIYISIDPEDKNKALKFCLDKNIKCLELLSNN